MTDTRAIRWSARTLFGLGAAQRLVHFRAMEKGAPALRRFTRMYPGGLLGSSGLNTFAMAESRQAA